MENMEAIENMKAEVVELIKGIARKLGMLPIDIPNLASKSS